MNHALKEVDIISYLPHILYAVNEEGDIEEGDIFRVGYSHINGVDFTRKGGCWFKPILRPMSDLYKTIKHNGREEAPIVELAGICVNRRWELDKTENCAVVGGTTWYFGLCDSDFVLRRGTSFYVVNYQYKLFDYLHSRKFDYRGLISAGFAVNVNTLEKNPYQ